MTLFCRYVFHEVRVPLNTACRYIPEFLAPCLIRISVVLAVQNMEASGTVDKGQEIEFTALEGSLSMMSKGLSFIDCLITDTDRAKFSSE